MDIGTIFTLLFFVTIWVWGVGYEGLKQLEGLMTDYHFPAGNLPAPNWSPNGEEGYWVWRNEKWKWLTDEEYKKLKEEENGIQDTRQD